MKRVFIALMLSLLVTVLCAFAGPLLVLTYMAEGAWRGVRETWDAWWAFARLPWVV